MDKNAVNRTHNYKKRFFFLSYPFSYLSSLSVWVHKSFFLYYYFLIFISICVCCCAAACGFCCATFERVEMRKQVFLQFYYLKLWVFWHSKYRKKIEIQTKIGTKKIEKKNNWNKKKFGDIYKFVGFDVQKLDLNYLKIKNTVEKYKLKLCGNVELT